MPLQLQRRGTEVFNVSAQVIPMREIVTSICRALDRPVPRLTIPIKIVKAAGSVAASLGNRVNLEQQIRKFTREDAYDGKLFEETFGFKPQVSLADGSARRGNASQKPGWIVRGELCVLPSEPST